MIQQVNLRSCQFAGYDIGVRHFGTGGSIIGCRFEVNNTAIQIGFDQNGNNWASTGIFITAIQCERNNTDVDLHYACGCLCSGIMSSGLVNVADTGPRDYGIRVRATCNGTVLSGCNVGGNLKKAGISLDGNELSSNSLAVIGCCVENTGTGGGPRWITTAVDNPANKIVLLACNT
jgi:hypothetical protein